MSNVQPLFTYLPDSPQSVGDMVGLACRLVRNNIKQVFSFLLVPTIFATIAGVAFQWVLTYGVANMAQTKNAATAFALASMWFVGFVMFALAWWVLGMRMLALMRCLLGFSPTVEDAAKNLYRKKWAVIGLYLLSVVPYFGAVIGLIGAIFAGTLIAKPYPLLSIGIFAGVLVGMLVASAAYMTTMQLSMCCLACEEPERLTVLSSFARGWIMFLRHYWRHTWFGIVFMITFMVVSYPMSLPIFLLNIADLAQHGLAGEVSTFDAYKPPLYILVLSTAWESVIGIYLRPLVVFAFGLLYYDTRLRAEGLDIKRKMDVVLPETLALE